MAKIELNGTIQIGEGCTDDMLKGMAQMAEDLQSEGITFKMQFQSGECRNAFVEHLEDYYAGECDVSGDIVTIQGRG